MIESAIFIGAVIAGTTQLVKLQFPQISGFFTGIMAIVIGILIGIFDTAIGVVDVSVAEGIMTALGTFGTFSAIDRIKPKQIQEEK